MSTLPLFGDPKTEFAERLAPRLAALARRNVFIGTSSWKYEGWLDQIYSPERYWSRGRFSRTKFEAECLAEYGETFPIVCGDFSFYQFPAPAFWQRLFSMAPGSLRFAFKVPEDITVRRFPKHDRYGARAGLDNETFLNAGVFSGAFLEPLAAYRARVAALIFEFGSLTLEPAEFIDRLDGFLTALPGEARYAVEVRNAEFLTPEYFRCLNRHRVAHVLNSWTRMPELGVQMKMAGSRTSDFTVVRGLLRPGRSYEDAVARFSPYRNVQDPSPPVRRAMVELIQSSLESKTPAHIFVNNRLEGNAPGTIEAILDEVSC